MNLDHHNEIDVCCADCGEKEGGIVSLKMCMSCKLVKYCNAKCQRNHWSKHKKVCKIRAAELRDEALFKDPPPKEDCPICFLPMPEKIMHCISLPPATITSIPIFDFAIDHNEVANASAEEYYSCCGKYVCSGCIYSFSESQNIERCPFCKTEIMDKTDDERVNELMKRVAANDAGAINVLGNWYYEGIGGLQQDQEKAKELWKKAVEISSSDSQAHFFMEMIIIKGEI